MIQSLAKKKKKDPILGTLKRRVQESDDNNNVVLKGINETLNKLESKIDEVNTMIVGRRYPTRGG